MKLDSRIKSLSDILTCFDVERAKEFLGEKGYFAGDLYCFMNLQRSCLYGTLANVFDDPDDVFQRKEDSIYYPYFVPECLLKSKEKQYKPFDPVAFEQHYGVGCVIKFRNKGEKHLIYKAVISAIVEVEDPKKFYVLLGNNSYTFGELFERYEMCEYGEWVPFGLKVEEEK